MQMIVRGSIQCDNSRQIHLPRTDLTAWLAGGGRGTKKGHVIVIWWIGGGPFNSEEECGVGYTTVMTTDGPPNSDDVPVFRYMCIPTTEGDRTCRCVVGLV